MDQFAEPAKSRGPFFTPSPIAEFLSTWAIHSAADKVLEPSCGEATFLLAAGAAQSKLPGGLLGDLVGVELHAPSAEEARAKLREEGLAAHVHTADFFDWNPDASFDVVLGNPPFIRYQNFTGEGRIKGIEAALRQGVRLNKLASAWAAFVVHACGFLKPDGRLGFVLPAELLSVNYAATVRSFLLRRFASLKIVTFEHKVFPGVQEEIVLLLASGYGQCEKFDLLQAKNLADLEGSLGKRWANFKPHKLEDKWTYALIPDDVLLLYRSFGSDKGFEPLGSWGRAYLGSVTGANDFFVFGEREAHKLAFEKRDLLPVLPPGSSHLKGVELSKTAWMQLREDGRKVYLFSPISTPSEAALRHIKWGEDHGINKRYKCQVRNPWWRVPLVTKPDLFISYMTYDGVRLIANNADLQITNSHYGFNFAKGRRSIGQTTLSVAALNSLTLLGSEMEGRSYGGGLLKIEPREVERVPLPSLSVVADAAEELEAIMPQVATKLRKEKLSAVSEPIDTILLKYGVGLSTAEIRDIRRARRALFDRRIARNHRQA
jgi:adenine-specific DNA-methyltransferase